MYLQSSIVGLCHTNFCLFVNSLQETTPSFQCILSNNPGCSLILFQQTFLALQNCRVRPINQDILAPRKRQNPMILFTALTYSPAAQLLLCGSSHFLFFHIDQIDHNSLCREVIFCFFRCTCQEAFLACWKHFFHSVQFVARAWNYSSC